MNPAQRIDQAQRKVGETDGSRQAAIDDAAIARLSTDDLRALVIQIRIERGDSLATHTPQEIADAKKRFPRAARNLAALRRRIAKEINR